MINSHSVTETIKVYESHGWVLRRLSGSQAILDELTNIDPAVFETKSDFGIAWFSRPPAKGPIAWELRYLGEPPYALVEHLDENSSEFDSQIAAVEGRLREIISARRTA